MINLSLVALGLLLLATSIAVGVQLIDWAAGMVTALFGTIGLGLAASAHAFSRENRLFQARRKEHPNAPWMWDARWQVDRIPSRSRWDLNASVYLTVVVFLLAVPMLFVVPTELAEGNLFALLGIIPIVVAVILCCYSYRSWWSSRVEKRIALILETRPAFLGTQLSASLKMLDRIHFDRLNVSLEHIKVTRLEEADGISFHKTVNRRVEAIVQNSDEVAGKRSVAITAELPTGNLATAWGADTSDSYWDMVVEIGINGRHAEVRYEVPIAESGKAYDV